MPISAANLALTPEPTAVDVTLLSQSTTSGRALDAPADSSQRGLTAPALLATQPGLTPIPSGTPGPSTTPVATRTATLTPTPSTTPTATPFGTPPPTATPTPATGNVVQDALTALNNYRVQSGRAPLQVQPNLMAAAQSYARLMADNNWFYCGCDLHTGPDGSQPEGRIARAGYPGRFKGEAISGGQATGRDVINAWLNSPLHAAILLEVNASEVGIGYVAKPGDLYGHYWVLVTGNP